MSDKYYLPMTSMNFIAAMNAYVLSPAQFYINRKYYFDITKFFPNHIMAFKDPRHVSGETWNDDDEKINFPVIVEIEIEIPSGTDIERVICEGGKLTLSCLHDKIKAGDDILLLLPFAIPLSSIKQVFTPGEKTMNRLKDDPYLEEIEIGFEISLLPDNPSFSGILGFLESNEKEIEVYHVVTEERPEGFYISGRELEEMNDEEEKKIVGYIAADLQVKKDEKKKSKKLQLYGPYFTEEKTSKKKKGEFLNTYEQEVYEYQFAKKIEEDRNSSLKLLMLELEPEIPATKTSFDVDILEKKFSLAGGCVIMGEATWRRNWAESMGYSPLVLSSIASTIQADSEPTKIFNAPDYSDLVRYQAHKLPYKDESISCLGKLGRLSVNNDFLSLLEETIKAEKGAEFFKDSKNKLVLANTIAFLILIHETINSNPDTKSVTEIIDSVSCQIKESCKDFSDLDKELERIRKGLQLIKGIVDGTEELSKIFNKKVSWATSLRAASLFALRNSPEGILDWKKEERPDSAMIADYYAAAFLAGNYTGFTRLQLSIKDKWKSFVNEMMKAHTFRIIDKPEKRAQWELVDKHKRIVGTLSLEFPDNNVISVRSEVELATMVKYFVDSVYKRIEKDKLKNIEKSILAIIAIQNSLTEYKLIDITLQYEKAVSPRDGSVALTVPERQIRSEFRWDYKGIADHLADTSGLVLSTEIIALLCHQLEYEYHNLEYHKEKSIEQKISKWLLKMKDSYKCQFDKDMNLYHYTEIHKKGIELLELFAGIIANTKLNQQQEYNILESSLYFAWQTDIISESVDPDLGMIDDWIIFLHACNMFYGQKKTLNKPSKKSESEKLEKLKECSDDLDALIRDEFGVYFVDTIISKFDLGKTAPGKKITARKE